MANSDKSARYKILLGAAAGAVFYLFSFLGWMFPKTEPVLFLTIAAAAILLALKRFELALALAAGELVFSSFGRLLTLHIAGAKVSLRMALFAIIVGVWIIRQLQAKSYPAPEQVRYGAGKLKAKIYYLPLFIATIWGIVRGFINGTNLSSIFTDGNGFFYFGYLGPAMQAARALSWEKIKNYFAGAILWLWTITAVAAVIFSYRLESAGSLIYRWIRDVRLGEITDTNGVFSRIFFQSHIFALAGFLLFSALAMGAKEKAQKLFYASLGTISASILILDLSRSFWVGAAVGIFAFLMIWPRKKAGDKQQMVLPFLMIIGGLVISSMILPPLPSVLASRGKSSLPGKTLRDPAVSSRAALLPVLMEKIKEHPVWGSGFGTAVSYKTSDPRALEKNPSGEVSTFAFEWGWLDIWLKMGLFGVLAYIWLIFCVLKRLYRATEENKPLAYGLFAAMIALTITHTFSPYLNHPLGIGFLLFADAIAENA